ncbi:hypothetical protein CYMTET_52225 [Cymbomonas tetramitiformis]|uniref:Uncharacterized protein n=1 Tax=Cymbomonas tetramitiformis TaxID=36881 RepID=A0AAE0BJF2_9CHLO|nr:hypothetical protein CYMTET_52225 [Cymbomonas tetramitiformis]
MRGDEKFHGRDNREGRYYGRPLKHRFAAKPLNDSGNWRQQHYKKESAHNISFHVASSAFIPEYARCPPGYYHDSANCPTDDMACEECDLTAADESDEIVSAFQTVAFDAEDDAVFARLCIRHEQPVVSHDEEPFTFAADINIGLLAQYAGLCADSAAPHSELAVRVQEARNSLRQLKRAAGGAGEDSKQSPDSEPPFEDSFMDKMSVSVGFRDDTEGYCQPVPVFPPLPGLDSPPPSPDYSPGPTDDEAEASGTADSDNTFNLDSGYLDFEIENNNDNNFCELCTVDHFRSG